MFNQSKEADFSASSWMSNKHIEYCMEINLLLPFSKQTGWLKKKNQSGELNYQTYWAQEAEKKDFILKSSKWDCSTLTEINKAVIAGHGLY